jgi:NAD(P)-dependent dehydrogenase (short-subunit alcohol dehydrogenase family)
MLGVARGRRVGYADDMRGKTCVITGGTDGIGKQTGLELARLGARLVLVGRNAHKAERAAAELRDESGNPQVEVLLADLASQAEVRRLAEAIRERCPRLDVLVNNAGAYFAYRRLTADGIESTFAVNHLAYFQLTALLLPLLRASVPARIVNVASGAHTTGRLQWDDLGLARGYGAMRAYCNSKLANLLFTYELARRLEGSGVTANALHPGAVATGWGHSDRGLFSLAVHIASPFLLTVEKGARTPIYLASSPEVEGVNGKYFYKCRPVRSSRRSLDLADAKRLWDVSEEMLGMRT